VTVVGTRSDGLPLTNAYPVGVTTVTYTATDACSNRSSCNFTITVRDCAKARCSFTQGYYGNNGGKGSPRIAFINNLLPITVGACGHSITFSNGSAPCIIRRMPAGGPADALYIDGTTNLIGNIVVGASDGTDGGCELLDVLPLQKKGDRFRNVLLGQTIALALNVKIAPTACNEALGNFELRTNLCRFESVSNGTNCPVQGKQIGPVSGITQDVLNGLTAAGLGHTVNDLLILANRALGGCDTLSGLTLSEIAGAAGAINEAFDECGFVAPCEQLQLQ
jgi:hypothetical protein